MLIAGTENPSEYCGGARYLKTLLESIHSISGISCSFLTVEWAVSVAAGTPFFCTECCQYRQDTSGRSCRKPMKNTGMADEPVMFRCSAGFWHVAAPVLFDGCHRATLLAGPFLSAEGDDMRGSALPQADSSVPVSDPVVDVAKGVPVLRQEVARGVLALISSSAELLSMYATSNLRRMREAEERRTTEIRLHQSENLYRTIFEHSGTAMAIVRGDGSIIWANICFSNLFMIDQDALCGVSWTIFASPEEQVRLEQILRQQEDEPTFTVQNYETTLSSVEGREIRAILNVGMIPQSDRYVISLLDVTERRHLEEVRASAFDQIERNFTQLAVLNDQIRNPLAAIVGLAGMSESEDAGDILRHAMTINAIVTHLDERWLESETVRKYLRKHHHIET
ncbi:PocR ligand-binding domain-containing protein [Methanofollis fontis]|nr:PocR ligand-binding domain-containing protein [Methanofollis fontis]